MSDVPKKQTATMPLSLLLMLSMMNTSQASADFDSIVAMAAGPDSLNSPIFRQSSMAAADTNQVVGEPISIAVPRVDPRCAEVDPRPGAICDTALYSNLMCNVRHLWSGCSEDTMACLPVESCTCNGIGSGRWECWSMASPDNCPDPSAVPSRKGQQCDPSPPEPPGPAVENSRVEPTCDNVDPFPGRSCDAEDLECGTRYALLGCTEAELRCVETESCKCRNGSWRCIAMASAYCEDQSLVPAQRGNSCDPSDVVVIENGNVQVVNNADDAEDEPELQPPAPEPATTTTTSSNSSPIKFYGLNYNTRKGPDWAADRERCKTRGEVVRDLRLLSRITSRIRILSMVDCNQGALVWSVLSDELSDVPMEVWLGLWVGPEEQVFVDEYDALAGILPDVLNSEGWRSRLTGISVGSEAIYREDVTIEVAIENLQSTRNLLSAFGMGDVPVAIVDIAPIYSNSQQLRLASDIIMTNTFPFWEGLPVELATSELEIDLGWLVGLPEASGKPFVLSEHGWPSGGYLDGVGVASPENQKIYLANSFCYLRGKGWPNYFFTAIDNDWRQQQDPDNTIEGNWGFLTADLELKDHFRDMEFSCEDGTSYSFKNVDWTVPELPPEAPVDPSLAACGLWRGCEALAGDCCPTPGGDFLGCCRDELFLGLDAIAPTNSPTEPVVVTVPVVETEPPTRFPTRAPRTRATADPTQSPTKTPIATPVADPTAPPTRLPVADPTPFPTPDPTGSPTRPPTPLPTSPPTFLPTSPPVDFPTLPPTQFPTGSPTKNPTLPPTKNPTLPPTAAAIADDESDAEDSDSSSSGGVFPPWEDEGEAAAAAEESVFVPKPEEASGDSTDGALDAILNAESSGEHRRPEWSVTLAIGSCLLSLGLACLA